jgi:hypothetical protein
MSARQGVLENLKTTLRTAYELVAKANRKSHQTNKQYYDQRAKTLHFNVNEWVYLYNPAVKRGLTWKSHKTWTGAFRVTKKISELNYEIEGRDGRRQVVHVIRLKRVHDQDFWNAQSKRKTRKDFPKRPAEHSSRTEEGFRIGPFPMVTQLPSWGDGFSKSVFGYPWFGPAAFGRPFF